MGLSVVEGEGVADKLGGGALVDVELLVELAERVNLIGKLDSNPSILHVDSASLTA
jgi:hypothetical protein